MAIGGVLAGLGLASSVISPLISRIGARRTSQSRELERLSRGPTPGEMAAVTQAANAVPGVSPGLRSRNALDAMVQMRNDRMSQRMGFLNQIAQQEQQRRAVMFGGLGGAMAALGGGLSTMGQQPGQQPEAAQAGAPGGAVGGAVANIRAAQQRPSYQDALGIVDQRFAGADPMGLVNPLPAGNAEFPLAEGYQSQPVMQSVGPDPMAAVASPRRARGRTNARAATTTPPTSAPAGAMLPLSEVSSQPMPERVVPLPTLPAAPSGTPSALARPTGVELPLTPAQEVMYAWNNPDVLVSMGYSPERILLLKRSASPRVSR